MHYFHTLSSWPKRIHPRWIRLRCRWRTFGSGKLLPWVEGNMSPMMEKSIGVLLHVACATAIVYPQSSKNYPRSRVGSTSHQIYWPSIYLVQNLTQHLLCTTTRSSLPCHETKYGLSIFTIYSPIYRTHPLDTDWWKCLHHDQSAVSATTQSSSFENLLAPPIFICPLWLGSVDQKNILLCVAI